MSEAERAALLSAHRGLVVSIAADLKRRYRLGVELEELEAAGIEGLLQAESTYDPARGVAFSSFAYYRVRGAILDNCRRLGTMRRQYRKRARFEDAANAVLASAAYAAPDGHNSAATSIWIGSTLDSLAAAFELSQVNLAEDRSERSDPEARLAQGQLEAQLSLHLDKLTGQDREVLQLYYFEGLRMPAIGTKLGVSTSWVSRVHARALEKLREWIAR